MYFFYIDPFLGVLCDVIHGKGRINTCLYCNVDVLFGLGTFITCRILYLPPPRRLCFRLGLFVGL